MKTLGVLLLITGIAQADLPGGSVNRDNQKNKTGNSTPGKSGSLFNTNIYEKTNYTMNFTDTVKLVREDDSGTQVMFMKKPGFFAAPSDETSLGKLVESQSTKTPVQVSVDEDSRKILKVQLTKKPVSDTAAPAGN